MWLPDKDHFISVRFGATTKHGSEYCLTVINNQWESSETSAENEVFPVYVNHVTYGFVCLTSRSVCKMIAECTLKVLLVIASVPCVHNGAVEIPF